MIRGTIKSLEVENKSGTGKKSGKHYSINEQAIMLAMPNGEIRKHSLTLDDDSKPLAPGQYEPKPTAIYLDGFDLKLSNRARDWQLSSQANKAT